MDRNDVHYCPDPKCNSTRLTSMNTPCGKGTLCEKCQTMWDYKFWRNPDRLPKALQRPKYSDNHPNAGEP